MSLYDSISHWVRSARAARYEASRGNTHRSCRFEQLEPRQMLAADIQLGAVYYEDNSGADENPDVFEITWTGGEAGTQLTRLVINMDKAENGIDGGDLFFDTTGGGLGVFSFHGMTVTANGFTITSITTLGGSSNLDSSTSVVFTFSGFDAGEKLTFSVDVDEQQDGLPTYNAHAEGAEMQNSILEGRFEHADFKVAEGRTRFTDAYSFAGTGLNLPPDNYMPPNPDPSPVRTAGALLNLTQQPLPASISGRVHVDTDGDCAYDPGELLLSGVTIELLNSTNVVIATTTTDVNGEYSFTNLTPGTYSVREIQPPQYLTSGEHVGSHGGVATTNLLSGAVLGPNAQAVRYDFCEMPPGSISGRVHVDTSGDCLWQPGEVLLSGVKIELLDANGNVLHTTFTDANGQYSFQNLAPGTYSVRETQPTGYLSHTAWVGSAGGVKVSDDQVGQITLGPSGVHAVNYDFCEGLPGSISGRVHVDTSGDCIWQPGEVLLSGVTIQLLDSNGAVLATTLTDAQGEYKFEGLIPGLYTVRQVQPNGYLSHTAWVGSSGGVKISDDEIGQINLGTSVHAVRYDFCEGLPATISGYVFQDGATLQVNTPQERADALANLAALRPGVRGGDDTPLAGVTVVLTDINGNVVGSTTTNASGYYQFTNLRGGTYNVRQVQPTGYIDGIDTPGTTGGVANNPGDFIGQITVAEGQVSRENNFSEVLIVETPPPTFFFPPPANIPPPFSPNPAAPVTNPAPPLAQQLVAPDPLDLSLGGRVNGVTWHLSVVNAGTPRVLSTTQTVSLSGPDQQTVEQWQNLTLDQAQWLVALGTEEDRQEQKLTFGMPGAIPVAGDFNGDGTTDLGIYFEGQWFIDVNGNGTWDEDDLWAKLGSRDDLPVVGDWDGDGKTDIGIFGRTWPGDPHAISREPGIPTVANAEVGKFKNPPPRPEDATDGKRTMQLSSSGTARADLIDHVFAYGVAGDKPVAGDWNGDGIHTIGVFRDGQWHLDIDGDGQWGLADMAITMGEPGDEPVIGDFNGDGVVELGIFRDGFWHIDDDGNHILDARDRVFELGGAGDLPVVGDWDGDGQDDAGIYGNIDRAQQARR